MRRFSVGAERTGAQDLDRISHSIGFFPHALRIGSAVYKDGNVSILRESSKEFEWLLDTCSVNDHPVAESRTAPILA